MFEVGNKVEIVKYGSLIWTSKSNWKLMLENGYTKLEKPNNLLGEDEHVYMYDMSPKLVGQQGIIIEAKRTQGKPQYAIKGPRKHAWYNHDQLKLIT